MITWSSEIFTSQQGEIRHPKSSMHVAKQFFTLVSFNAMDKTSVNVPSRRQRQVPFALVIQQATNAMPLTIRKCL
jgi:hypothetical protein